MTDSTQVALPENAGNYAAQEVKFNFRKNELGTKRASLSLQLKFLTLAGLVKILESGDEKQINLILETLQTPILEQARSQVDDNETITQETLDESKLSWEAIANMPPATRKGGGIPKEVWEAFVKDYIEVMPGVTGKTVEQVTNAGKLFGTKYQAVKTNKPVIKVLLTQLDLWFSNTSKAEEFAANYEFLKKKGEELLAADEAALLANL